MDTPGAAAEIVENNCRLEFDAKNEERHSDEQWTTTRGMSLK